MDTLTPEQRHKCMSHIKSKNTSIETAFRRALWHEGIRYRKNYSKLPGKPDIAITKHKIAIFCDGEFWHGKNWNVAEKKIKTNRGYWIPKIEQNISRDNETDMKLYRLGWIVLHFWGKDIQKNLADCVREVKDAIFETMAGNNNYEYGNYDEQIDTEPLTAADNTPIYCPEEKHG
jgi:DNA mismatch endonuclease (patch repair protein)